MILSAFSFRTLTLLFIKVYNTQLSFKCQSIFVLFSIQSNFSALLFDFSASPAYNRQRVIKMNWIHNHKRALLHINLAFIGGLTGVYAILVRSGNFGAAQTMNLIEMVLNFTEMNLTDAFLRLAIFILYGLAIIAAFLIGEHFASVKSYIALAVEAVCIWIAGIIPTSVNPLIALFPVFILNAYQWQAFTTPECYNSSTIFSTNNYKQTLLAWTRYHMTHDLAQKKRALLFTNTLILFHLGVLVGYFAVEYLGAHGIWVAFVPLVTAVGLVIPVGEEQVVKDVEATLKEGIHRTEEVVVRKV